MSRRFPSTKVTRVDNTIFIPLPREMWTPAGTCNCPVCKGAECFWDTLAVGKGKSDRDYTWTVHYPELHGDYMETNMSRTLDKFTQAYIECALWSSGLEDDDYDIDDIAEESLREIEADCADFQDSAREWLEQAGIDAEQAGHNFWLTRNRHGTGFWDRGLGKVGEELTAHAHTYDQVDPYVGDDDKVYFS
jgi:hypothetical protein